MRKRAPLAPGLKDKKAQTPLIEDLGQLKRTIATIGYTLPDVSVSEQKTIEATKNRVECLLSKNQELVDNRSRTYHDQAVGSVRKLLSSSGLGSIAEKIEDAVEVLDSVETCLPKLISSFHAGEAIPVEVNYQKDFFRLVKLAASHRKDLSNSTAAILWLLKTKETPKLWKDLLDEQSKAAISLESAWNQHSKLCQLLDNFKSDPEQHLQDEDMHPEFLPDHEDKSILASDAWMDIDKG